MKQWGALTASPSSHSKFPQCEHPRQPGTKERVSVRSSKRHLSTLASNRPKYDEPTGPSCHWRGPFNAASVSEPRPVSGGALASRPWADVQKCNRCPLQTYREETTRFPALGSLEWRPRRQRDWFFLVLGLKSCGVSGHRDTSSNGNMFTHAGRWKGRTRRSVQRPSWSGHRTLKFWNTCASNSGCWTHNRRVSSTECKI